MTTATMPTYETAARGKVMPMVSHPPGRGVDDEALKGELPDEGLDMVFVADIMSAALAHERAGRQLYRSVAGRTHNPMLKRTYEEFGRETERHAEILEGLIGAMGGDPRYVSPAARATAGADKRLVESTHLLGGSVDVMTAEMVMLDAVLMAEAIDHANWVAMRELADALPDGQRRGRFRAAVDEVLADEDKHLDWARTTRTKMIVLQAEHETLTSMAASVEELMERVRRWFT
jgi:rubrerythrin